MECMAMSFERFSRTGKGPVRLMEALAGDYLGDQGQLGAWDDWGNVRTNEGDGPGQ